MRGYWIVFLGAGLGGALRHGVNFAAVRAFGAGFPWGTLAVNVAGSLAMGLLAGWFAPQATANQAGAGEAWRLFLATGVLGGFTTFSAFSLDAALLWEHGSPGLAGLYVAGSVLLSVAALLLGLLAARLWA